MYSQEGNYKNAITEYENFASRYWRSSLLPVAFVEIGDAYFNLQKYDKALQYYQKVLLNYPQHSAIYNALKGIEYVYGIQEKNEVARKIIAEFYLEHPEMKRGNDN